VRRLRRSPGTAAAVALAAALAACSGTGSPGSRATGPVTAATAVAPVGAGAAPASVGTRRVSAWEAAPAAGGPSFHAETVRMVVHSTVAGGALRLHFSNLYGSVPLVIGGVDVALRAGAAGAAAVPRTHRRAAFTVQNPASTTGTATSFRATVPAGGDAVTRPVPLHVDADQSLLVSVYLPNTTGPATFHDNAADTSWTTGPDGGDQASDNTALDYPRTTTSWYFLDGVDLVPDTARDTVAAFGDSITDGSGSLRGTDTRWPDDLARRFAARPGGQLHSVIDAGIGGNRLLTDSDLASQGVAGLTRFASDALDRSGVRSVIVLEGVNDIGKDAGPGGGPVTAQQLIAGLQRLIDTAHAHHVRIYGGTLLPYRGAFYWTARGERIRDAVNTWIRTGRAFDGTIDFAKALADPSSPERLAPAYDSGDHLHPDSAGYQAMANAVNLAAVAAGD
jgi:lysophospholipase L1-like esterase